MGAVCDDAGDCSFDEVTSAEYVRKIGRLRDSGTAYIAARGQNRPALRRFSSCRGVIRTKACAENLSPVRRSAEAEALSRREQRTKTEAEPKAQGGPLWAGWVLTQSEGLGPRREQARRDTV